MSCRMQKRPGANRFWRRRTGMARSKVAASTGLCGPGSRRGRGVDLERNATMRAAEKSTKNASADLAALAEIVERFDGKRIVLFGDFVADEFQFGDISRVSREAPVLILRHRETRVVPGGGANAANNLAALGAHVVPVTVLGDDTAGAALLDFFRRMGVVTKGLVRAKDWPTPTKTRFLAGWTHTVPQQVLRVDREPAGAP